MRHRLGVGLLVTTLAAGGTAGAYAQDYKVLQRATLGGEGGWDLLAVDAVGHRLYVARGTRVMVIDAETLKLVGEIPDTAGVHGVAVASDLGRGFTSNGRTSNSTIFDLKTLAKVGEVKTGENPDAILYEPKSHRVLAFNGRSKDVTVIDAKAGTVAGTVLLEGQPELAVDDGTGTVFVNLEDKSEVVALDPVALKVKARWPLAPCEEPTGLAIDRAHRRLFAACANKMMAVMNADSGKVVTTLPIGQGPDGAAFDSDRQLAFSPNGRDGMVTVIHEISPDKFEVVQTVDTAKSARTIDLDPKTHKLYLVAAQFGPPPSPTTEQPRPRPAMVPGTFEVLVVGR
ncbi:MAG TPA: YncE family protein [Vicinamibacteria bacterium]|nr:YncE family protein [Vicinamibacteria bacterium]